MRSIVWKTPRGQLSRIGRQGVRRDRGRRPGPPSFALGPSFGACPGSMAKTTAAATAAAARADAPIAAVRLLNRPGLPRRPGLGGAPEADARQRAPGGRARAAASHSTAGLAGRPGPLGSGPVCCQVFDRIVWVGESWDARGRRHRDAGQLVEKLPGGGPLVRILGQGGRDQRPQRIGDAGDVRVAVHDPVQDRVGVPGAERRLAGGRVRHRHPPDEDVGRRSRPPADLLRRHEPGRADHHARPGHGRGVQGLGDAEVDDLRARRRSG